MCWHKHHFIYSSLTSHPAHLWIYISEVSHPFTQTFWQHYNHRICQPCLCRSWKCLRRHPKLIDISIEWIRTVHHVCKSEELSQELYSRRVVLNQNLARHNHWLYPPSKLLVLMWIMAFQYKSSITVDGFLLVRSDKTRSQQLNLADALDKLRHMIHTAAYVQPPPSEEDYERSRRRLSWATFSTLFMADFLI